jgi:hypothetical protein
MNFMAGLYAVEPRCVAMSAMGDIDEIQRVKYRYLRALDTKHWDDFADTLTEDIVGDYGSSLGEEHHFTDRESLVEFMRSAMPANILTEHRVTHPEIDVDGDEATGIWYLQDRVIVPDFNFMLYGAAFYHDRYRRTADGWRISATGYERTYEVTTSTESLTRFKVKPGRALNI